MLSRLTGKYVERNTQIFFRTFVSTKMSTTFHDLSGTDIEGNELSFSKFKNKVVYVTNVASA